MVIHPVEFNGILQTSTENAAQKANENARPEVQQNMISDIREQEDQDRAREVHTDIDTAKEEFDPERDGSGTGYQGNRNGRKKEKTEKAEDGKVIRKDSHPSFDVRI